MKKQSGFSIVYILLLFTILIIIGGTGWYVLRANKYINDLNTATTLSSDSQPTGNNHNNINDTTNDDASTQSTSANSTSYKVQFDNFTLSYPEGWNIKEIDTGVILRGPNNFKVSLHTGQGLGGVCDEDCQNLNIENRTLATFTYFPSPLYAVMNGMRDDTVFLGNKVTVFNVLPVQNCYYNVCYGYKGKYTDKIIIIKGGYTDDNDNFTYINPDTFANSAEVQTALEILATIKYEN